MSESKTLFCSQRKISEAHTLQVVGLGISGRAAVRLALARGAAVLAIDRNEKLVPLEVCCDHDL